MDERCFRPLLCTVKAELGRGQPGLMTCDKGSIKIPLATHLSEFNLPLQCSFSLHNRFTNIAPRSSAYVDFMYCVTDITGRL